MEQFKKIISSYFFMRAWILIKQWCQSLCFPIYLKTSLLCSVSMMLPLRHFCWTSCSLLGSAMGSTKGRWKGWQKRERPILCRLLVWSVNIIHQWYFLLIKGNGQSWFTNFVCSQNQLPHPPLQWQATLHLSSEVWLQASQALSSLISSSWWMLCTCFLQLYNIPRISFFSLSCYASLTVHWSPLSK